jgi:hypothetical protein
MNFLKRIFKKKAPDYIKVEGVMVKTSEIIYASFNDNEDQHWLRIMLIDKNELAVCGDKADRLKSALGI